jgi:hypothetical protein
VILQALVWIRQSLSLFSEIWREVSLSVFDLLTSHFESLSVSDTLAPLSMVVNSSLVSSLSDPPLSPGDILIKWRPVTESAIGSWQNQTIIPGSRLLSWLVSMSTMEITGFVVKGRDRQTVLSTSHLFPHTHISCLL